MTSTVYAAGAYSARQGKIYQTAAGGTSGATPPTHTSGDASDGAVTWTFVDYAYGAPIGLQGTAIYDTTPDGQGVWAGHFLSVRKSGAGTTYGIELGVSNNGASVTNNPYSISPSGATIGLWIPAGYDVLASTNPSSCAIAIGRNDNTWNSGIVFQSTGISSGGYAIKYAAISDHAQGWFNSSGQEVFAIYSTATANNERTKIVSSNSKIELYSVGGVMATISSGASAGTAADEHVNLIANAAGTGYANINAHGTASNIALRISARGTENVLIGAVALRPITNDGTSLGTSAAAWSDADFANGAVIRFNNSYTLTHSTGLLTASGALTVSGVATFSSATTGVDVASTSPRIRINDTNAGSDQKIWTVGEAADTQLLFRTRTDVDGAGATWLTVTRSGTAISSILFGAEVRVSGDTGGAASTNTLTGTSDVTANSTGVGTILFKGATSRNSTGFIKFYVGTTAYYVPIFSAITG